jgi:two-component system, NtrC family, C4-dicarboxylate transport sensor histidine kinase DctB
MFAGSNITNDLDASTDAFAHHWRDESGIHLPGDGTEDRMFSKRPAILILAAACLTAVVLAVYLLAAHRARADIHAAGDRQLQIIALDLESVLEKFETLPFTLAHHPDVPGTVNRPDDRERIQRLNLTLQSIQRQAKVSAIYLMDRSGNTLASSNWDQPLSFVGKNFAFRPYFRDAMEGRAGRFYGIGSTTSEPGYFIAQPVNPLAGSKPTAPVGVIAVKISLAEFEQTWRSSEEPVALADASGVVFLSNRASWRYHSMRRLDDKERHYLGGTLQYAGQSISPITTLPKTEQAGFGEHVGKPVGRLGWQLMLFPSQARVQRTAALTALTATLLMGGAGISWWAVYQRRRRLEERSASRQALQRAAEELDRNIAQRTQELLEANQRLESKYAKLQETEHLLRTTQNELVQAGKLAMLGQMAAGVTHELNQPLAAIRAFADNAVTFLARGQGDKAGENLAQISAASARMGAIIGQLKGFARKSHETVSTVDLAQAVHASALLLDSDFRRHGVQFEIDIRQQAQVTGDAVRTEQVLINLLRNALDAVETATVRKVDVILEREAGDALVRIRDSGAGIPEQVAPHLFEPFFTTKASGKGLGLGLAISSSIVQAMNGQLTAQNHTGGGAEFVVRLPAAEVSYQEGGRFATA